VWFFADFFHLSFEDKQHLKAEEVETARQVCFFYFFKFSAGVQLSVFDIGCNVAD